MKIQTLRVGPIGANAYIVWRAGSTDALIIDAGDDAARILRVLDETGLRAEAVLLTHGHFDHILAAPAIREATGAKICVHEKDAPMLLDAAKNLFVPIVNTNFAPFTADELFRDGEIERAGMRIRLIHTPGHTPGGLCYYFLGEDALFTGDTLFDGGVGRTDLPGGDMNALEKSIAELLTLPPETRLYPGHGESSTIGEARRYFR